MSLCIAVAGKLTILAVTSFTLSWTHSVEKTTWREEWLITSDGLVPVRASVQGSGAGMEPPPNAISNGSGGWIYRPQLPPQRRLLLADSGTAGSWRLCSDQGCMELGGSAGEPIVVEPCQ